jgi:formaldehyde-activating enzyme involved in methanogenesis
MSKTIEETADPRVAEIEARIAVAKAAYDEALIQVDQSIEANLVAMNNFKSEKNDANREAYAQTRAAHKAAIEHIKVVRPTWKNLVKELQTITG